MPTKEGKTYATTYPNDLTVDNSSHTGITTVSKQIVDGKGNRSFISLSDDIVLVAPNVDDTTAAFAVRSTRGTIILAADTTNNVVKSGAALTNVLTLEKEMGLFDFSPTAGVHNPLIATNMMFSDAGYDIQEDTSMFGNGTDPATTLDITSYGTPRIAIASYWYLDNNITIDSVRYMAMADGSATLNFHIMSYTMDNSTNFGDLSAGAVHANASVSAINSGVKTGTFSLDTANIDLDKVVIGFVENATDTSDVSVSFQIKYHIR